jgi:hypothetical protein
MLWIPWVTSTPNTDASTVTGPFARRLMPCASLQKTYHASCATRRIPWPTTRSAAAGRPFGDVRSDEPRAVPSRVSDQ